MDGTAPARDPREAAFVSRPVPPEVADAYFEKVASYEADRLVSMRKQRNAAFIGATTFAAVAALLGVSAAGLAHTTRFVPVVAVADKCSGVVERATDLAGDTLSDVEAFNRAFAKRYVEAREAYTADEVPVRNKEVAAFSSVDEYMRYKTNNDSPAGNPKLYARKATVRVIVKAIHQLTDVKDAKQGVIEVSFDRAEIPEGDDTSLYWSDKFGCLRLGTNCKKMSAKIDFQRLGSSMPESLRNDNPLGWLVTQYEAVGEGT